MKFNDFDIVIYPTVYPPSDDSYLLYDHVELQRVNSFLEIGCGTGILTLKAAKSVGRVIATDISLDAVQNTVENLERNGLDHNASVLQCDLLNAFSDNAKFDVIAWNPPYLPREDIDTELDDALVGGEIGNEIIMRFLQEIPTHLEREGSLYLVVSTLSVPEEIARVMRTLGLGIEIVAEKNMFFEKLLLLKGTIK